MIYEPDDFLNPVQAAAKLGRGAKYIRDLCERGELPHECNGTGEERKHYRIRYQALCDYMARQEAESIQRQRGEASALASSRPSIPQLPDQSRYLTAQRTVGRGRGRSLAGVR
jgi:hypothetical protein